MITKNDPIIAAITAEEQALEKRLVLLRETKRKLAEIDGFTVPAIPTGGFVRTPEGELKKAILEGLKRAGPIMMADLKRKIVEAGYPHHVNSQYATKTIKALVKQRVVKKVDNGPYSTYQLIKA